MLLCFNLIQVGDEDLRRVAVVGRRALLRKQIKQAGPALLYSDHLDGQDGEAMFRHACAMNLEGIVSKRVDSRYKSGRCLSWVKVKNPAYERGILPVRGHRHMADRAGWGAYVTGELIDLADWEHMLKAPFTPWLERSEADVVLRSAAFDTLQDPREVADRATALIDLLNGALAVSEGTRPITFGGVVEFQSDGTRTRVVFPVSAYVELRGVKARGVAGNLGPAPPPIASEAQVWAEVSDREPLLADALVYYGRRTDWFDIYKALECLEKKFGGETSLRNRLWMPRPALEKLKQTANSFRHARLKFEPVVDPMPLDEARRVLGQLIRCAFEEMSGRSHG